MNSEQPLPPLRYEDIPRNYALCPNAQCPRASHCLRHHSYTLASAHTAEHLCLMPQAWGGEACRHFAPSEPQTLCRGMKNMYLGLQPWQATALREQLRPIFGSDRHFYRYQRGEYVVSPERQAQVAEAFRRLGLQGPPRYDHTFQAYFFNSRGFGSLHSHHNFQTNERIGYEGKPRRSDY